MNPFQHGEVFVTDDGGETDLDLGHYERFVDVPLTRNSNATTGSIYQSVLAQGTTRRVPRPDRAGDPAHHRRDQGPHPRPRRRRGRRHRDHRDRWHRRRHRDPPVPRGHPAVPQGRRPRQRVLRARHAGPVHRPSGEQKTKPTQHSVTELRSRGIQPDAIVCRSDRPIPTRLKEKISQLCDVPEAGIVSCVDAPSLYEIPLVLHDEGLDDYICSTLHLDDREPDLTDWRTLVAKVEAADRAGAHRSRRQVHQPARRLPVGGRGAQARRLRAAARRSRSTGSRPTTPKGSSPRAASAISTAS